MLRPQILLAVFSVPFSAGLAFPTVYQDPLPSLLERDSDIDASVDATTFNLDEAVELEPILDTDGALGKRRESLDLRDKLKLKWGNRNAQASLEADFAGDDENVINMEDFGDVLEKVDCTPPRLVLDFKDRSAFDSAKSKWNWVNEKDARHFYMLVNHPDCKKDTSRVPYRITNVKYNAKKHIVYLDAEETDFKRCVHDGHLVMETFMDDTAPQRSLFDNTNWNSTGHHFKRASVSKDVSLKQDISGNIWKAGSGNTEASLDCVDCGTNGKLKVKFDVSIGFLKIKKAYLEFTATGTEAKVNLTLSGKTSFSNKGQKELFSNMIVGVKVPGVGKLGLGPAFGVGYSNSLAGEGRISWGAGAKLADPSVARVCLKGCDSSNSGWKVTYFKPNPTAQGNLNLDVEIFSYLTLSAGAEISLIDKKYEAGVALLAPKFTGDLDAEVNSQGGVCADPAKKLGVAVKLNVAAEAYAYLGRDFQKPSKRFDIFKEDSPLFDQCFVL